MDKLLSIIRTVRDEPERLGDYGYLSTSEWLVVCLGVGTPDSIAGLKDGHYPTIPEAWQRIGESGRSIVQQAWQEVAL